MGILRAIIEVTALTVFHPGQDLALRRAVALELIRDDKPRDILTALEELKERHALHCLL